MVRLTAEQARHQRAAVRLGNQKRERRKELGKLLDTDLAVLLGKYLGRTGGWVLKQYHYAYNSKLNRERVIDIIVEIELGGGK